jgi:5-methylcytosine-specific restriction protein A
VRAPAKQACSNPTCPHLATRGLCPKCRREQREAYDRRRPGARARGYDRRWERTRKAFLAAHPDCELCPAPATDADHRDGLGPNGPAGHDFSNLRALCHSCHSARTARDQPGGWNR